MLWTNPQSPSDDVHIIADVHALDVHGSRGWREEASQDGSDKHQKHEISPLCFHVELIRSYNPVVIDARLLHGGGFAGSIVSEERGNLSLVEL